jgi:SAM-dependent methyltransferase
MEGTGNAGMTAQPHELFTRHWSTYRQVVEHDWMEHRPLTEATARVLETWIAERDPGAAAPALVDLGCGDLALLAPLLRRLPLGDYLGIDLVEAVFPLARAALGTVPYPSRWRRQDLLEWAIAEPGDPPVELIHTAFAIHHLTDAQKQAFLAGCRRRLAPGGRLLWGDVFREPGETRSSYLERYRARIQGLWTQLDPVRQGEVVDHMCGFDLPGDRDAMTVLARREGWALEWVWQGHYQAEALAVLRRNGT